MMREERQYIDCYEWMMKQQYAAAELMKFNSNTNQWSPLIIDKQPHVKCQQQSQRSNSNVFTTLTLNVLTDCTMEAPLKRNILFSADRYAHILHYLQTVQPHVVTFNQATHNFYSMLIQCQWVKDKYLVSQFNNQQSDGSFNVIMSRAEPIFLRKIKINNLNRDILTLYLAVEGKIVSISCAHLTSLTSNIERRQNQLRQLTKQLNTYKNTAKDLFICHIIQGDLNIHSQSQNPIFSQLNLIDSWVQYHGVSKQEAQKMEQGNQIIDREWQEVVSRKPGYTFDGQINSMIKQVYWGFEGRRMRLDRVVHTGGVRCRKIEVTLNQPIYKGKGEKEYPRMGAVKGVVSLLFDIAGYNAFRTKQEYLFPSDHFGLLGQMEVSGCARASCL